MYFLPLPFLSLQVRKIWCGKSDLANFVRQPPVRCSFYTMRSMVLQESGRCIGSNDRQGTDGQRMTGKWAIPQ